MSVQYCTILSDSSVILNLIILWIDLSVDKYNHISIY